MSRIVYLGPLKSQPSQVGGVDGYSPVDTGDILASGTLPLTWLRTAVIIGSGSASFEILRYLTERSPIMVAPQWIRTPVRPIAMSDVIRYLLECIKNDGTSGLTSDMGGPDITSFRELIDMCSDATKLHRRLVVCLPLKAKALSAY